MCRHGLARVDYTKTKHRAPPFTNVSYTPKYLKLHKYSSDKMFLTIKEYINVAIWTCLCNEIVGCPNVCTHFTTDINFTFGSLNLPMGNVGNTVRSMGCCSDDYQELFS